MCISYLIGLETKPKPVKERVDEDKEQNKIKANLAFEEEDGDREADLDDIHFYLIKDKLRKNSFSTLPTL